MSVVSPELGVGTLEGRVSVRLGLLDTAVRDSSASIFNCSHNVSRKYSDYIWTSPLRMLGEVAECGIGECVPVPVVLLRLIMLGGVLGL
jgi:hypothetical protein